jgi:hypothetical protein
VERLTGPLADALARQREPLNARFADARRTCSTLDANALFEHLTGTLDPIVRAVAKVLPERVDAVTLALYELSLELFVARLLGPEAKTPCVAAVWRELLPVAAAPVAREPGRLAACTSNAIVNIAGTPGARPREWLDRMIAVAGQCPDTTTLLDCGKILAWQAGMAQYRAGALDTAAKLAPPLAATALGLPQNTAADVVRRAIATLKTDPWLTSVAALEQRESSSPIRFVAQAGAFRGFGGPFIRPPTVSNGASGIFASDGDGVWQLLADAYGTVFVRADPRSMSPSGSSDPTVARSGEVRWGAERVRIAGLAHALSFAGDDHTLAVTLPTSHHVFLLARAAEN